MVFEMQGSYTKHIPVYFIPHAYSDADIILAATYYFQGDVDRVLTPKSKEDGVVGLINYGRKDYLSDSYAKPVTPPVLLARVLSFYNYIVDNSKTGWPSYEPVLEFTSDCRVKAEDDAVLINETLYDIRKAWHKVDNIEQREVLAKEIYSIIALSFGFNGLPLITEIDQNYRAIHNKPCLLNGEVSREEIKLGCVSLSSPFESVILDITHELTHALQRKRLKAAIENCRRGNGNLLDNYSSVIQLLSDISVLDYFYVQPTNQPRLHTHYDRGYKWQLCEIEARAYSEKYSELFVEREDYIGGTTTQLLRG